MHDSDEVVPAEASFYQQEDCGVQVMSQTRPEGLIWDAVGPDAQLAVAAVSVRAGRTVGVSDVLKASRQDHVLRSHRSQLLGALCARSSIAEMWLREEPANPDALLLYARTAVARAVSLAEVGDTRAETLARIAQRACEVAADAFPTDPTPYAAMLALARCGGYERIPGPGAAEDVKAPWSLLSSATRRAPEHREAHHQFLRCLLPRHGGSHDMMWNAVRFLTGDAKPDSDLQILPLVAFAEHYKARRSDPNVGLHLDRQWATGAARLKALDLFDQGWFARARASYPMPIADMSYLAHALFMADNPNDLLVDLNVMLFITMSRFASVL